MLRFAATLGIVLSVVGTVSQTVFAGPKVRLGSKVATGRQISIDRVDHRVWNAILKKYVDADGMVNYRGLKSSSSDLQALNGYLQQLATVNTKLPAAREAKLAYWINAYNAVTVRGILREYPTSSIRNHTARLAGYNIWKDLLLRVGDSEISLDAIEHQVLRKMNEPRIHFAIVCASIGCPRLLNEAYVAERIDEQLEINARDFFARPQNFRHDSQRRRFELSSILSWFGKDFGATQAEQLKTIAPWLPTRAAQQAAVGNAVRVSFLDYNWDLNEQ